MEIDLIFKMSVKIVPSNVTETVVTEKQGDEVALPPVPALAI